MGRIAANSSATPNILVSVVMLTSYSDSSLVETCRGLFSSRRNKSISSSASKAPSQKSRQ
jgi:hypothetical protein